MGHDDQGDALLQHVHRPDLSILYFRAKASAHGVKLKLSEA